MRQMLSCLALLATTSCGNPPDPMVPGPVTLSGSRLRQEVFVAADGARQPTGSFWDTRRGEECALFKAGDGQIRCLPSSSGGGVVMFTDASCTQAVVGVAAGCSLKYGIESLVTLCAVGNFYPTSRSFYAIGIPIASPPVSYARDPNTGRCAPGPDALPSGNVWHTATPVDPGEFVAATIQME